MRFCALMLAVVVAGLSHQALAQHVEIGGFGSYEAFSQTRQTEFPDHGFGLGGRVDFNLARYLQLELETSYDFKHAKLAVGNIVSSIVLDNSKLGVLHGNAGFKLQSPGGSFFVFIKGGANRFDVERNVITVTSFPTVSTLTQTSESSFTKGVFYPGGGIGFHAGPLGIRLDAGDEIYWDDGARHNLRITFGPTIRF